MLVASRIVRFFCQFQLVGFDCSVQISRHSSLVPAMLQFNWWLSVMYGTTKRYAASDDMRKVNNSSQLFLCVVLAFTG